MSRRTAEASRAVKDAWERERRLVLKGKGTRDWVPEQQQAIVDKGRAYDNDGRAFQGHHMKSVKTYPEWQGDAGNIQFLTRDEHQEAHGGSFRNPTNGCYSPSTRMTSAFGDGKYVECSVINLSEPLYISSPQNRGVSESDITISSSDGQHAGERDKAIGSITSGSDDARGVSMQTNLNPPSLPTIGTNGEIGIGRRIQVAFESIKSFCERHPPLIKVVKCAFFVGLSTRAKALKDGCSSDGKSGVLSSVPFATAVRSGLEGETDLDGSGLEGGGTDFERRYPDERKSPVEHEVSGYERQFNGKTIQVKPYKRGGK